MMTLEDEARVVLPGLLLPLDSLALAILPPSLVLSSRLLSITHIVQMTVLWTFPELYLSSKVPRTIRALWKSTRSPFVRQHPRSRARTLT